MSTEAQIRANRSNAEHSTGPRTDAGKAASSQNRVIHRLSSKIFLVLPWEKQEEYDELLIDLRASLAPQDSLEHNLVETMAQSKWLARRAVRLQNFTFHEEAPLCEESKDLALYLRYQTTHERAFDRALKQLSTLRAEKRKTEIGFELQKQKVVAESRRQAAHEFRAATEKRRQDRHKFDLLLAEARHDHQALCNLNLGIDHPLAAAASHRTLTAQNAA